MKARERRNNNSRERVKRSRQNSRNVEKETERRDNKSAGNG